MVIDCKDWNYVGITMSGKEKPEAALGHNIKIRLAELGMTQLELAEKLGFSQVMVHKLVSGKSKGTTKMVELAKALQCSPEELLYGFQVKEQPDGAVATSSEPEALLTVESHPRLAAAVRKLADLPEEDRETVFAVIESLELRRNPPAKKK